MFNPRIYIIWIESKKVVKNEWIPIRVFEFEPDDFRVIILIND